MSDASLSLLCGARAQIHGLTGAVELNGLCGTLDNFDDASCRWELDVDKVGFQKIKAENLSPTTSMKVSSCSAPCMQKCSPRKHKRLCRYGIGCWRPGGHFEHSDDSNWCRSWYKFWKGECAESDDTYNSTDFSSGLDNADEATMSSGVEVSSLVHVSKPRVRLKAPSIACSKYSWTWMRGSRRATTSLTASLIKS